jgi:hypothetical protein
LIATAWVIPLTMFCGCQAYACRMIVAARAEAETRAA